MNLVSVIIPAQNRPEMLREAVNSVLAQSHTDLELIIVLKGATPEVHATAADLCSSEPRARTVDMVKDNTLAFARNFGIAAATGEWVAFLDDDDLWLPTKLQRQLEAAEKHGADFVATGYVCFNERGDIETGCRSSLPA